MRAKENATGHRALWRSLSRDVAYRLVSTLRSPVTLAPLRLPWQGIDPAYGADRTVRYRHQWRTLAAVPVLRRIPDMPARRRLHHDSLAWRQAFHRLRARTPCGVTPVQRLRSRDLPKRQIAANHSPAYQLTQRLASVRPQGRPLFGGHVLTYQHVLSLSLSAAESRPVALAVDWTRQRAVSRSRAVGRATSRDYAAVSS